MHASRSRSGTSLSSSTVHFSFLSYPVPWVVMAAGFHLYSIVHIHPSPFLPRVLSCIMQFSAEGGFPPVIPLVVDTPYAPLLRLPLWVSRFSLVFCVSLELRVYGAPLTRPTSYTRAETRDVSCLSLPFMALHIIFTIKIYSRYIVHIIYIVYI